jgi:ABC-type nitrate/sulfonate/bicarbonate transport system substrate-binding protein
MLPSHRLSRRRLGAVSVAFSLAMASATPIWAQGAFEITYAYGWISNIEQAPLWSALDQGYFSEAGLDVDYVPGGPNAPDTLVSLSAGSADIVTANWLPILDAVAQGNDFVILGAMWWTSPSALITRGDLPLDTADALVGKRILAQKTSDSDILDAILDLNGLPHDYTMVPTGFSPEPLLAGDGDVYFAFATNQPISLEMMGLVEGTDFHTTLHADLGYNVKQGLIVAERAYVEQNRPQVVAFLQAMMRGWQFAIAEPAAVRDLVINTYGADLGLDPDQQLRQMEVQAGLVQPPDGVPMFTFDPALIEGIMTTAAGDRTVPPASQILDLSLAEEAAAGL